MIYTYIKNFIEPSEMKLEPFSIVGDKDFFTIKMLEFFIKQLESK